MRSMTPAPRFDPAPEATGRCGLSLAPVVAHLALAAALLGGCGYHLVGHSATLPAGIQSIGIPTFVNRTNQIGRASCRERVYVLV